MNRLLRQDLIYSAPAYVYYQPDFKQIMDAHLQYLKTFGNVSEQAINVEFQGRYIGDFYAILNDMQINARYHRVIMLLNGYTNPIQYKGDKLSIMVPDTAEIDGILSVYNTARSSMRTTVQGD